MLRTVPALITAALLTATCPAQVGASPEVSLKTVASHETKIDVVFVLDTTGSMGGLIEGAKQKIWSIANQIATAKPRPQIRMGLVAYRDKGDEYVTKLTALTDDLDAVYSDLMKFTANGGGDAPESVNQGLNEAVTKFAWDKGDSTLRLIYLVGDCPPHMDYQDDVKYPKTCELAAKAGIIINTVQCGSDGSTTPIWREIARSSEGQYFAIAQSGGMVAIATPYDAELGTLGRSLEGTVVGYGTEGEQRAQASKQEACRDLAAAAPAEGLANRAVYKAGAAGGASLGGQKELVKDCLDGKADVSKLAKDELPPEMLAMTVGERKSFVEKKAKERSELQTKINDINVKRQKFIDEERAKLGKADSFDASVMKALREQATKKGIAFADDGC